MNMFVCLELCLSLKELKVDDSALLTNDHSNGHLMGLGIVFLDLQELVEALAVSDVDDLEMIVDCFDLKRLQANLGLVDLLYD